MIIKKPEDYGLFFISEVISNHIRREKECILISLKRQSYKDRMHCSRSPRRDFFSINIDQQQLGQIVQIIESRTCKHDHTLLFLYNQLYKIVHSCIKRTSSSIWLGFSSQLFHNFMQIKMNCGLGFGEYGSVYWEFWIKYIDSSRWHIWKSNLSFFWYILMDS